MSRELIMEAIDAMIAVNANPRVINAPFCGSDPDFAAAVAVGVHRCAAALERIAAAMEARGEAKP